MIVTLDALYEDSQENLDLLEHLFKISLQQNENFTLVLDKTRYTFSKKTEKEVRTKAFRKIIEKHKPP